MSQCPRNAAAPIYRPGQRDTPPSSKPVNIYTSAVSRARPASLSPETPRSLSGPLPLNNLRQASTIAMRPQASISSENMFFGGPKEGKHEQERRPTVRSDPHRFPHTLGAHVGVHVGRAYRSSTWRAPAAHQRSTSVAQRCERWPGIGTHSPRPPPNWPAPSR